MRRPPRGLLRGFWCLIRQGLSVREAAAGAGVLERRCWDWFSEAGGMPPLQLAVSARSLVVGGSGEDLRRFGRRLFLRHDRPLDRTTHLDGDA
jgi:hypothetical protein